MYIYFLNIVNTMSPSSCTLLFLVDVGCHRTAVIGQYLPALFSNWLTQTVGRPAEFFTTDTSHKPVVLSLPSFLAEWLD